jgi:PTH2 family peptidyl-tRNA hydrolase
MTMSAYKQAIILREDLDMSRGKMIAQACHASLKAYKKADSVEAAEWENGGSRKIVLEVGGDEIRQRLSRAKSKSLPAAMVKDAGRTELEPGTETAIGIGPAEESKIDSVTGDLKLIK